MNYPVAVQCRKIILKKISLQSFTYMFWHWRFLINHVQKELGEHYLRTGENFPRSKHFECSNFIHMRKYKSHYAQNIKSPKENARLNIFIHFHKTKTMFPMLLVCNIGNFAIVQWSKKRSQFVCLFVLEFSNFCSKNAKSWPNQTGTSAK